MSRRPKSKIPLKTKRITVSLDEGVVAILTKLSRRMGMSRSALLNMLLRGANTAMEVMYEQMPEEDDAVDLRRFRGQTVDMLTEQYADAIKQILVGGDLFDDEEESGE